MSIIMQQSWSSGMGYYRVLDIILSDQELTVKLTLGNMIILRANIDQIKDVKVSRGLLNDKITIHYVKEDNSNKWFTFNTPSSNRWREAFVKLDIKIVN